MDQATAERIKKLAPEKRRLFLEKMRARGYPVPLGPTTTPIIPEQEAFLPADVEGADGKAPPKSPGAIFMTGATGFVGAYILEQLVARSRAQVYCLVRADHEDDARKRIVDNARKYGLYIPLERVVPIVGELDKLYFGLGESRFGELRDSVDSIFHVGANTNLVWDYQSLLGTNVIGTQEALRLAAGPRPKDFNFVSTLGLLFMCVFGPGVAAVEEAGAHLYQGAYYNGYLDSKAVAEIMVERAGSERNIPFRIFRPGYVTGSPQRRLVANTDFFCNLVRIIGRCGSVPIGFDPKFYATPVDRVAEGIVDIVLHEADTLRRHFHLVPDAITFSDVVAYFESTGDSFRRVPLLQWMLEARQACAAPADAYLSQTLDMLSVHHDPPLFGILEKIPRIDHRHVTAFSSSLDGLTAAHILGAVVGDDV